jgi:Xaa-Pro aminopeptidase
MITTNTYAERRYSLLREVKTGLILLVANKLLPRNYAGNVLPFRQDSNFLYYTGLDSPGFYCILDCETGEEILCGEEPTLEDAIWSGSLPSLKAVAGEAGISNILPKEKLADFITSAIKSHKRIHYLPPYTANRLNELSILIQVSAQEIGKNISPNLIHAVIKQRRIKTNDEISEIENVITEVTGPMFHAAIRKAIAGNFEYEIVAEMQRISASNYLEQAFPIICSVRGEVLHNISYSNILKDGDILLIDAGVESTMHYASDITRTTPVGGKFTSKQKEIYEIVLEAQLQAIKLIKPGIKYREIHLITAAKIVSGLKQIGLMKGDVDEAVNAGAHAMFFPHGLGHMMGLDVHDMEDLGENAVGYGSEIERSTQFGTAYLRLARILEPGFVLTVEPGIYFIPALINLWESEKKFEQFICYSKLHEYINFGGIRIEDDVLVTTTGNRILGSPIAKTVKEIEGLFI